MKRRDFLRSLAGATGAAAFLPAATRPGRVDPDDSGIEHVVVVMMENRSFDHVLGWLPTADGRQSGLRYTDVTGRVHATFPLAPDYTGCGHRDPDHSYLGGRFQYAGGTMSGFLKTGNDEFSIGYYVERARPFASALARHYTTLDRSFCSILGPTFPNRIFLHAAQTDRLTNTLAVSTLPTIWDRLADAGVSHAYYYSNLPFLALWGSKYLPIASSYLQFLIDAATGTLPAVSFVDPIYTVFDDGTGNDDHPHADIRRGDAFLARTFHAVANGPAWPRTIFIATCDEWGGFFDHVAPPRAAAANAVDPDLVQGKALLGFRVPTIMASPWTRGWAFYPRVNSGVSDHTSILKLIEWRWGLPPLTPRDASNDVQNLARVLNFDRYDARVPLLPQPLSPPPVPCATSTAETLARMADSPLMAGWPVYQSR